MKRGTPPVDDTLITTKFFAPRHPRRAVHRPRLHRKLKDGLARRLTVVAAPAGFGKTTLLSQWRTELAEQGIPVAWVSLDEGDDDPRRFFYYIINALERLHIPIKYSARELLGTGAAVAPLAVARALVNDLAWASAQDAKLAIPDTDEAGELGAIGLALDDYHCIASDEVHHALDEILFHAPPTLHVALASRSSPPLSLARLRAQDQLIEIDAKDLRFTPEEAAVFLNESRGLILGSDDIGALVERTEGWIAGLQLAALALHERTDRSQFIRSFSGSHRSVTDYLGDDVLGSLPAEVQQFLFETSILEEMSNSVCNAVTGRNDGQTMLEWLERANLFLVALDNERIWYRYHHLFGDVLRERLARNFPDRLKHLHSRAGGWFERQGRIDLAIGHWLATGDMARAADLAERVAYPLLFDGQKDGQVRRWLQLLDDPTVRSRPVLAVCQAWALTRASRFWEAEDYVDAAEAALRGAARGGLSPARADEVAGQVLQIRGAIQMLNQGDTAASIANFTRALGKSSPDDAVSRGVAQFAIGLNHLLAGDVDEAAPVFDVARAEMRKGGGLLHGAGLAGYFAALTEIYRGQIDRAEALLLDDLAAWRGRGSPPVPMMGLAQAGLAQVELLRSNFYQATQHIEAGLKLVDSGYDVLGTFFAHFVAAEIASARGDEAAALAQADAMVTLAAGVDMPLFGRLARAQRVRLWLRYGRMDLAAGWAAERDIAVPQRANMVEEVEGLALARLLIAQNQAGRARILLRRLLESAERAGRQLSIVEVRILLALSRVKDGEADIAIEILRPALLAAEKCRAYWPFLSESRATDNETGFPALAGLLGRIRKINRTGGQPMAAEFVLRLLSAMAPRSEATSARFPGPSPVLAPAVSVAAQPLAPLEPLSSRERRVLQLVAEGLTNQEIAERLFVAHSTVKKHVNHIYAKLEVRPRTRAIARGKEFALI